MFNPKMKHKFLDEAEKYGEHRMVDAVRRAKKHAAMGPGADGMVHEPGEAPESAAMHAAEGVEGELAEEMGMDHAKLTPSEMAQLKSLLSKMR